MTEGRNERELRLALVCYGGVSLAVYMNGITREILKLVRASKAYHARPPEERGEASYRSTLPGITPDTEPVYFDLLRVIAQSVELRVVVDVIAGASAGGINGIMLARALAFDLSLEGHRDFWLRLADVTELLDSSARAGLMSKPFLRPAFWLLSRWRRRMTAQAGAGGEDPEVLQKLSLFMRSRWFKPPFSGRRMSEMMLDALMDMGSDIDPERSLLPPGLPLELFVTTTDFWGHPQSITLHDPPVIEEREHRHILHFCHIRHNSGEFASQLSEEHIPSLAFAARATSSFPGAFPPARLAEMDELLRDRGLVWMGRDAFLAGQFAPLIEAGEDPEESALIDGSVLMNKPISLALRAVQSHVAHREVDRRLVYIEPNPEVRRAFAREIPGFFKTLKGALSDIPRNQPIRDDLEWLQGFNKDVRLQRQVVEIVRPRVMAMIAETLGERLSTPPDAARLASWRQAANERAARDANYAYDGYARLKVLAVLEHVAILVRRRAGLASEAAATAAVHAWAKRNGIRPPGDAASQAGAGEDVAWINFLRRFDLPYRLRRLQFLIRRANELYAESPAGAAADGRRWLDGIKAGLYLDAEALRARANVPASAPDGLLDIGGSVIEDSLEDIALDLDLPAADDALDARLSECVGGCPDEGLGRELIIACLGFPYYDVVTLPMTQGHDVEVLDEIKVDRISVNDANTLKAGSARQILKGVEFGNFGAFFSRRFRENDYLWGRLTAAERLVDIVASAAPEAVAEGRLHLREIKKRLFLAILDAEAPHLHHSGKMIEDLRRDAEKL